jgi:hypothetical protein
VSEKWINPFMTLIGIDAVQWDALGQVVLVQAHAGQPGSEGLPMDLALTPETAESLLNLLAACVRETRPGEGPVQ